VYARSTTFHGRPENVEKGIKFIADEAAPMLAAIEGCRGMSVLVDRDTGQCIVTTSWDDEATMRKSDAEVRPLRERGRDLVGGSMQADEWEIAVMHHDRHGACCRVSWLQGDLDAMASTFRLGILPDLQQTPGFCNASLLLDRASGIGCATTTWESRAAMEASRAGADELRRRAATDSGGAIVDVHEFDLVHAHLHVPEMA
jgi:heme-degrading monooxygenase HmoA